MGSLQLALDGNKTLKEEERTVDGTVNDGSVEEVFCVGGGWEACVNSEGDGYAEGVGILGLGLGGGGRMEKE
jgi:hypothetical protein